MIPITKTMRFIKFPLALILAALVSAYLSAVSMCLVALVATPKTVEAHSLLETFGNVLFKIPLGGAVIAAPVCAAITLLLGVALLVADRFQLFGSPLRRLTVSIVAFALPGIAFGRIAGSSACRVSALSQNMDCTPALWIGIFAFAIVGVLTGAIFAFIFTPPEKGVA